MNEKQKTIVSLTFARKYYWKEPRRIVTGIPLDSIEMSCGGVCWEGGSAEFYSPSHTMGSIEFDGEQYDFIYIEEGDDE